LLFVSALFLHRDGRVVRGLTSNYIVLDTKSATGDCQLKEDEANWTKVTLHEALEALKQPSKISHSLLRYFPTVYRVL